MSAASRGRGSASVRASRGLASRRSTLHLAARVATRRPVSTACGVLARTWSATQLVRATALEPVEQARSDFERAHDRTGSWLLAPLKVLPVVGRQIRSVDALAGSTAEVTDVGVETMRSSRAAIDASSPAVRGGWRWSSSWVGSPARRTRG